LDDHERGVEKRPGRPDKPLPEWDGSYRGDPRRLPRVVQKLRLKRRLSAEEKAELLWRLYELDERERIGDRRRLAVFLTVSVLFAALAGWLLVSQPWLLRGVVDIVAEVSAR
jgi:hypothetical protein